MKKRKFILLSLIVSAFVLVNLNVVSKKVNGKIGMTLNQLIQSVKADEECSVLNAPCVFDCCWGLHCEMGTCKSNVEWKEVPCHWEAWY